MAIRDWLKRIIGSDGDAIESNEPAQEVGPPASIGSSRNEVISYAVKLSTLVIDQPDAMAFYRTVFADHPNQFVAYNDLRKQGNLLDKDELKAIGLRTNVKMSAQFLATLNERGRNDPMEAAAVVGLTVSTALCTWRDLKK
ncbi:hypothetical protein C8024_05035 [Sphingopyxis sp. BSNA05]|uniref:hypothetical protein n=1 Tax=Sphingopyxis sp. BSNA05 TaxID=1236614 RepID=UPI0015676911|nr:hypothetical protein [Sphingopyxis sp. BSNA05]NRD88956.1 hypothetical protein [Sphingopyxis sp. BSNA05]